jgi:predicted dehydrogenase
MIGVGVAGCGHWGPNLIRNFDDLPGCRMIAACDLRGDRLALVRHRHPGVDVTADYEQLLADRRIDAIAVATPVASHYDMARRALEAGKHVLVEKPMTASSDQALRLIDEAARRGLALAVDHTFVHTGAVGAIRSLVASGELGDLHYYDATRVSLGRFQPDVDVVWDLAVHDLSIMDDVLPVRPCAVAATARCHVAGQRANIAYLTCYFEGNLIGHIHVNWLAPVKIRRTLVGGSLKMMVYDDLEPNEKIKVYDRGVTRGGQRADEGSRPGETVGYRMGDVRAPHLETTEPLRVALGRFLDAIERPGTPQAADGAAGLRVVRILEAATRSMNERGRIVELEASGCMA